MTLVPTPTNLPERIRVSIGTAMTLELLAGKSETEPTTAYLMTYKEGKCTANCSFCPQAKTSKSNTELLSRVTWPVFPTEKVLTSIASSAKKDKIKRICIQALNYPEVFSELDAIVGRIRKLSSIPVSISCQPLCKENIEQLKIAGVDRIGIAIDAATKTIFDKVKGKETGGAYTWENQFKCLKEAVSIFGEGNVSTHIIIGLGESEKEAIITLQYCADLGVVPGLFAFTPVHGTQLGRNNPPNIDSYRRIQLARYLIVKNIVGFKELSFDVKGKIMEFGVAKDALDIIINSGLPFKTSGCPNCNRPYYNEKPRGPIYNYPKKPNKAEIQKIRKELGL
jgi:lipoyl synthase